MKRETHHREAEVERKAALRMQCIASSVHEMPPRN